MQRVDPAQVPATCQETRVHPDDVAAAREAMPAIESVLSASELLKTIGDPTRMRILSALAERELCVCNLQAVLEMSQSAVSHQLRVLRAANLVKYRREGKMAYYSLADEHVLSLLQLSLEHANH